MWRKTLEAIGSSGKERRRTAGLEVRKVRETVRAELAAQALGRDPDGCLGTCRERQDEVSAGSGHPGELVEERDHVGELNEIERTVLERQFRSIPLLEAHALNQLGWRVLPGLLDRLATVRARG